MWILTFMINQADVFSGDHCLWCQINTQQNIKSKFKDMRTESKFCLWTLFNGYCERLSVKLCCNSVVIFLGLVLLEPFAVENCYPSQTKSVNKAKT